MSDALCLSLGIKVLLNNGDLQHTKITWFYPISMAPKRLRRLKSTWMMLTKNILEMVLLDI